MRGWALLVFTACGGPEDTDPLCDRGVPLTYESFGRGFLDTHCNGCHSSIIAPAQRNGAPTGIDFDTYEGVLQFSERLEVRVIAAAVDDDDATNPMPPGGGPTAEELAMLHEWLSCDVARDREVWNP
jgi:hypothetical protein